jgi:GT2 family glycosyltransferase
MTASHDAPRVSVVLATYNRLDLLRRVLAQLARQSLPPRSFEVVVVDDGSPIPARLHVVPGDYPFVLHMLEQDNAGPAAARHKGVLHARGEILVLIDDDMELAPSFLEAHLAYHAGPARVAVVGRYVTDPGVEKKPLFERYHGYKWDELTLHIARGAVTVNGTFLATGNTSMRREDYLEVGGLDFSLQRAEDIDLGVALEESGVELVYSSEAGSVHMSDHTDPRKWRKRAYQQGFFETRLARKHPASLYANPWRYAFSLSLLGRALCMPSLVAPKLGESLAGVTYDAADRASKLGLTRAAFRGAGLVYAMEYFRGMREEAGTFRSMVGSCVEFLGRAASSPRPIAGVPGWLTKAASRVLHGSAPRQPQSSR